MQMYRMQFVSEASWVKSCSIVPLLFVVVHRNLINICWSMKNGPSVLMPVTNALNFVYSPQKQIKQVHGSYNIIARQFVLPLWSIENLKANRVQIIHEHSKIGSHVWRKCRTSSHAVEANVKWTTTSAKISKN